MAVGVNATCTVQLPQGAMGGAQALALLKEKSPVSCIEVINKAAVPVLLMTTLWAELVMPTACGGKVTEAGAPNVELVPVPLSATVWAAGVPPKFTVRVSVCGPGAVGLNTTLISHFCPPDTGLEQLFVSENGPLTVTAATGDIVASP
jgi:hypothetical protein